MTTDRSTDPKPTDTPFPGRQNTDPSLPSGETGPTSPGTVDPKADPGPETGGYDDHSPNRHPTNEKGGYGAG